MHINRRQFIGSAFATTVGLGLLDSSVSSAQEKLNPNPAGSQPGSTPGAWHPGQGLLTTRWTAQVTPDKVWPEYPRPQLTRDKWMNLNGLGDYKVTAKDDLNIPGSYAGKIMVPFAIEAPLSGVMKPLQPDQRLWYNREIQVPAEWTGQSVLLHFGAVDWETTVYIDGNRVGSHRGGYDGFSFDVTRQLQPGTSHKLVVSVWDPTNTYWSVCGKQDLHPGGCSYSANSGIWQTVWLEPVADSHIERLQTIPDLEKGVLKLTVEARTAPRPMKVRAVVTDKGRPVAEFSAKIGAEMTPAMQDNMRGSVKKTSAWVSADLTIPLPNAKTWSPDSPFLYDLSVQLLDESGAVLDTVGSYFGMRSVALGKDSTGVPCLLLNGEPLLMPGALDQGFWPDGVYLAPTDEALRFDIEWAKKLGLNTLRKHVKIESERWYYHADKLGILVFQDMPTGGSGDPSTDRPACPEAADQWKTEVSHLMEEYSNHPSIVCWTMFNEAFGGFDYLKNVAWAKKMDPSRLVSESSGFPWHGGGDVRDSHGSPPDLASGCLNILSEEGTSSLGVAGHMWPHAWTYHSYDPATGQEMDFLKYYNEHRDTAILPTVTPAAKVWLTKVVSQRFLERLHPATNRGVRGAFYCQLVDVETECDGLMSYDRAVPKVDANKIAAALKTLPKLRRA